MLRIASGAVYLGEVRLPASARKPADLFGIEQHDLSHLTPNERSVYDFIEAAAAEDRELEPNDEIAHQCGWSGTGTVSDILRRLERKGVIKVESFQRGRKVWVARMEKWTAAPPCTAPHWRDVYRESRGKTPTVPPARIATVANVAMTVNQIMRERNLPMVEAQVLLMSYGVGAYLSEREA